MDEYAVEWPDGSAGMSRWEPRSAVSSPPRWSPEDLGVGCIGRPASQPQVCHLHAPFSRHDTVAQMPGR